MFMEEYVEVEGASGEVALKTRGPTCVVLAPRAEARSSEGSVGGTRYKLLCGCASIERGICHEG